MHGTLGHARRIFLTTDAVGGVWRYTIAIAAGLAARGWHCTVATMGPATCAAQQKEAASLPRCTLIDTGLPLDWTADSSADLLDAVTCLQSIARNTGAETVHLHTPSLVAFPWPLPVVAVAHSCVGTWWHALNDTPAPADFRWRMSLVQMGLQAAAAVIAPSQAVAAVLREVYGIERRIDVVHNGLEPVQAPAAQREKCVLTAARLWDRGKNIAVLDRAAALVDAPFAAAGPDDGPDGARFTSTRLQLLGNLPPERLRMEMSRAAIFAAPSLYEPFGLAVLEAAQLATPLVLADNQTFRELWAGAAEFADPHDHCAWAHTLRSLLDSPRRRAALGVQAHLRSQRYTAQAMVNATLAIHRAAALEPV